MENLLFLGVPILKHIRVYCHEPAIKCINCIIGGCKYVGVVNLWISLIWVIFMQQRKFTESLFLYLWPNAYTLNRE